MRMLLVNPNMSHAMTDRMAEVARMVAPPDTQIVPLTAPRGFPYIASRAEAVIGGGIIYEMIAEHGADADVAIVAAFGDPGLSGARELFDMPVVGMAEAALLTASMLGERIAIVTFSPVMRRWYEDSVRAAGLWDRFAGIRTPAEHTFELGDVRARLREELTTLCNDAAADGADVIIPGGAPLAGLAAEIQSEVDAIVVDPISAAVAQASALASLRLSDGFARRRSKPLPKKSVGLPEHLAHQFSQGLGEEVS